MLVLPWVVVAPLVLEFGAIAIPAAREWRNPYVRSLGTNAWPAADSGSALVNEVALADPGELPEPPLEQELAAHAVYLLRGIKALLEDYVRVYDRTVTIYRDGPGGNSEHYGYHGETSASEEAWLNEAKGMPEQSFPAAPFSGWTYRAHTVDPEGEAQGATAIVLRSGEGLAAVVITQYPGAVAPEDSAYRFAFLDLKKHGGPQRRTDYFGLPEFRINNFGFRDDDVQVPRPRDTFRVACVGASTTMEGPSNGFTYPNLVERFLREAFPGRNIEVINCGLSGIDLPGESARFADYLSLDPNVVLYYNAVNSITHRLMPLWLHEQSTLERWLRKSRFVVLALHGWLLPDEPTMRQEFQHHIFDRLFAMTSFAKEHGVQPVLATFCHPDGPNLTSDEAVYFRRDARLNWVGRYYTFDDYLRCITLWNQQLRELAQQSGITVIDTEKELTGGGRVFGDICHMKDYGIEQKARVIAKGLEPVVRAFYEADAGRAP